MERGKERKTEREQREERKDLRGVTAKDKRRGRKDMIQQESNMQFITDLPSLLYECQEPCYAGVPKFQTTGKCSGEVLVLIN